MSAFRSHQDILIPYPALNISHIPHPASILYPIPHPTKLVFYPTEPMNALRTGKSITNDFVQVNCPHVCFSHQL